jgi:hypothetical protein
MVIQPLPTNPCAFRFAEKRTRMLVAGVRT